VPCPAANRTNPAPSEPIAGGTDLVISAIEPTLSALKELSSLAKKIPYISPAAGLILQALKMWDVSAPSDLKHLCVDDSILGGQAVQGRVETGDGETSESWECHCQCWQCVPKPWFEVRRAAIRPARCLWVFSEVPFPLTRYVMV
jgi:hypothetical protein